MISMCANSTLRYITAHVVNWCSCYQHNMSSVCHPVVSFIQFSACGLQIKYKNHVYFLTYSASLFLRSAYSSLLICGVTEEFSHGIVSIIVKLSTFSFLH